MTDRGYRIVANLFAPAEVAAVAAALEERVSGRRRAGARHLLASPAVRAVAADVRLTTIASEMLGGPAYAFRATLFDKSPAANWLVVWHQDTALPLQFPFDAPGWGPWSTKAGVCYAHAPATALERVVALRVHLDGNVATNGPLRVLPGTHVSGVLSDPDMHRLARDIAPVDCVAASGGVVAMRPLLVHSSTKARDARRRRVLHIEYAVGNLFGPGVPLARA